MIIIIKKTKNKTSSSFPKQRTDHVRHRMGFELILYYIQLKRESSTGTASASSQSSLEGEYETGPNTLTANTSTTSNQVNINQMTNFFLIFQSPFCRFIPLIVLSSYHIHF